MKSRSNSAFLVFVRSLFYGLIGAAVVWLCEFIILLPKCSFAQLFQIPGLWLLPLGAGGFISFWNLSRKLVWRLLLLGFIAGGTAAVIKYPVESWQLGIRQATEIKRAVSKTEQTAAPKYDHAVLITDDPCPIYYVPDPEYPEPFDEGMLTRIVQTIQTAPDQLKKLPAAVYLVADRVFTDSIPSSEDQDIYGYTVPIDMTVYIRLIQEKADSLYTWKHDGQPVMLNDPDFYSDTIIHEMAHLQDLEYSKGIIFHSDSKEFLELFKANQNRLSEYAATDPHEFFAEAVVYWHTYPDLLQRCAPEVYDYFSNLLS
ncbi:MAG: hypothetical protein HUJ54_06865 [Erysipelotrichaceae bacterium]|nr:hypothetical protein [Erysipelotrichaceae bacterium]